MYLFFSVLMGIIKNISVLISYWRLRIEKKLAKENLSIKSDILHEFCICYGSRLVQFFT